MEDKLSCVARACLPLFAVATVVLFASRVIAGPVMYDPETWDSGLQGWTNATPIGTEDSTLSNPSGALRITFGSQGGQPQYEEDTIYTTNTNLTGNLQHPRMALHFTFETEDVMPLSSVLYLHSTSGRLWQYAFFGSGAGATADIDIRFGQFAGWSGGSGSRTDLWNDLANIDWIGVNIARKLDTIQQDYELDDWEYYYAPEPGTLCVLASAFLSLGITFRKKLRTISFDSNKA